MMSLTLQSFPDPDNDKREEESDETHSQDAIPSRETAADVPSHTNAVEINQTAAGEAPSADPPPESFAEKSPEQVSGEEATQLSESDTTIIQAPMLETMSSEDCMSTAQGPDKTAWLANTPSQVARDVQRSEAPQTIEEPEAVSETHDQAVAAPHAETIPLIPDYSVTRLIDEADHSAAKLVNLLVKHFPCFRDETRFERRRIRILKRAQIFVADLWAALKGKGYGEFHDIDHLTMFAGEHSHPHMH